MKRVVATAAALLVWGCGVGAPGERERGRDPETRADARRGGEATDESDRAAIERVLTADHEAGEGAPPARVVARTIARIDLADVPADFRRAYRAHVDAWQQAADLADEVARLTDPPLNVQSRMGVRQAEAEQRIASTFEEVVRVAMTYEAAPPTPRR